MTERRAGVTLAAGDGRTLTGVVIRYGDVATVPGLGQERMAPGALRWDDAILNVQHDRGRPLARTGGGTLVLTDTADALTMRASLPDTSEARDAYANVQAGILAGLSVEMAVEQERIDNGVRVIERARLLDIGLVDRPAYGDSAVEARARGGVVVAGTVPGGTRIGCGCQGGGCSYVEFGTGAFDQAVEADREILAVAGNYRSPIAARSRGAIRIDAKRDGTLDVRIEADGPAAVAVRDLQAAAPVFIRPYIDVDKSRRIKRGEVMVYSMVYLRALLVGATDNSEGLEPADVTEWTEGRAGDAPVRHYRAARRFWL